MARRKRITEAEWLASQNGYEMLDYFQGAIRQHARKLRLFAVACCRRIWHLLPDRRSRAAVLAAERYADGHAGEAELRAAYEAAQAAHAAAFAAKGKHGACPQWAATFAAHEAPFFAATRASNFAFVAAGGGLDGGPEHAAQSNLARCVFGNPFRPAAWDRRWRTRNAVALARSVYEERGFEGLALLADALEEAGCAEEAILKHCREPGEHARGCWVVDLVLGKARMVSL